MTDINRLHDAIMDPDTWRKRGSGKTTIMMEYLIGCIELEHPARIDAWICHHASLKYLIPMLISILKEHGFSVVLTGEHSGVMQICDEQFNHMITLIEFVVPKDNWDSIIGYSTDNMFSLIDQDDRHIEALWYEVQARCRGNAEYAPIERNTNEI